MIEYNEKLKNIVEDWETPYISTPQRVGRLEGRQEEVQNFRNSLERQIKRRFPHDVAERHLHLISQADSQTLSMWADNFIDAKNIDEVFAKTCLAHS